MRNDKELEMLAADCERLLRILIDDGQKTLDELTDLTGHPQWRVNELLTHLLLSGGVRPVQGRLKGRKATFYEIKLKGDDNATNQANYP